MRLLPCDNACAETGCGIAAGGHAAMQSV
ncbi:protein of unknown function [Cupriavidus neocaledonicus]|uniref:Uncharacterized protein n=1 Tax=Cupriavidus neocaledonicus TaxID=1040979 RepID=A0A375H3J9_9BURK|nr:protein of unknown function [Cupriavidus neocaledonicus]